MKNSTSSIANYIPVDASFQIAQDFARLPCMSKYGLHLGFICMETFTRAHTHTFSVAASDYKLIKL